MPRNMNVTIGNHFPYFIDSKIYCGCFESTSETVRAGFRLLEQLETQLDLLRTKLTIGEN